MFKSIALLNMYFTAKQNVMLPGASHFWPNQSNVKLVLLHITPHLQNSVLKGYIFESPIEATDIKQKIKMKTIRIQLNMSLKLYIYAISKIQSLTSQSLILQSMSSDSTTTLFCCALSCYFLLAVTGKNFLHKILSKYKHESTFVGFFCANYLKQCCEHYVGPYKIAM